MRVRRRLTSAVRPRGFTFIEVLIVMVLIGIIALIGSVEISRASQRTKLMGVANDLRAFFSQAVTEMQRVRCTDSTCASTTQYEVFLQVDAQAADGTTPVRLITDDNADGLLNSGDTTRATYTIPSSILLAPGVAPTPADALYTGPKTQVASLNWSVDTDDKTVMRALRLDFHNRAINVVGGTASTTMITGIAKLALIHKNMTLTTGTLTPLTSYELWISPVWNVSIHKGVWDGTKFDYPSTTGLSGYNQ
jgi:prepilin-type N-terminal cleavage/methylation domain-containing protein